MNFIVMSQKDVLGHAYGSIKENHILISIRNFDCDIELQKSPYCQSTLVLNFDDVEDIDKDVIHFDRDMAKQIITFVNAHCHKVPLIVVHCYAGVSRSVAVASALSKILNYKDDDIFTHGVPNMLVYTTLLEEYFSEKQATLKWKSINYIRKENMSRVLSPIHFKIAEMKNQNRLKEVDKKKLKEEVEKC